MSKKTDLSQAKTVKTPLHFFSMAIILASPVFAIAAAILKDGLLVIFCMHMFLAIVAVIVLIALWSPASLYHPQDLENLSPENRPASRPWAPTIFIFLGLIVYMVYQYIMHINHLVLGHQ